MGEIKPEQKEEHVNNERTIVLWRLRLQALKCCSNAESVERFVADRMNISAVPEEVSVMKHKKTWHWEPTVNPFRGFPHVRTAPSYFHTIRWNRTKRAFSKKTFDVMGFKDKWMGMWIRFD